MRDIAPATAQPTAAGTHWTAIVSCALSVGTAPIFALEIGAVTLSPATPVYQLIATLASLLQRFMPVAPLSFLSAVMLPLYVVLFIFGAIALSIASRPRWRKGRGLAIVGVLLPGINLALYAALIIYLIFFWHPHFHIVY